MKIRRSLRRVSFPLVCRQDVRRTPTRLSISGGWQVRIWQKRPSEKYKFASDKRATLCAEWKLSFFTSSSTRSFCCSCRHVLVHTHRSCLPSPCRAYLCNLSDISTSCYGLPASPTCSKPFSLVSFFFVLEHSFFLRADCIFLVCHIFLSRPMT